MKVSEYAALDATGLAGLIRRKEISPQEVLDAAIEAIEQVNPALNAIVARTYDAARAQLAKGVDMNAPFCGVPFVIKDEGGLMKDIPCTLGTRLSGRGIVTDHDTILGARFKKAGVVVVATAACPEFCWNNATETIRNGVTRNPWNPKLTSGGSSGGTAAIVAAGAVPMGHGSDGGGSIRMPAAACGLVGLKPTRFRIPTGPDGGDPGQAADFIMSRFVRDTAAMLDAVEGPDPGCYGTAERPTIPYSQVIQKDPPRLRIAYMLRTPYGDVYENHECVEAVKSAVGLLESLGHICVEDYPPLDVHYHEARILVQSVGTNAWIERVAKGSGLPISEDTLEPLVYKAYLEARNVTASAYVAAKSELTKVMRDLGQFMEHYDILISPTMGIMPLEAGFYNPFSRPEMPVHDWVLERRRWSGNTAMCNVTGQPSITVPLEWSKEGLPIGIEIDGRVGEDALVLQLSAQLERAKPWAGCHPEIYAGR